MKATDYDVAVVGGGPAGCSAAISLARRGFRVVLFESKTYPNDKMCGEFLSPEIAPLLKGLGMERQLASLHPVPIHKVVLTAPDETAWEAPLPGVAMGLSRGVLDAALAEQAQRAGAHLREDSTVTGVVGNLSDGFELEIRSRGRASTIYARAVISAHGKRGALDRVLGRKFLNQHHPFVAIKAHFYGPPIPGRIELHSFPGGYCGISEIEDNQRVVCLLVHERTFQKYRGNGASGLDRFVDWMKSQNLYLRSWLRWAERIHERWITIAQVPFRSKSLVDHDVLMAGDAAGMIVPLAGNGISMALGGGLLAAEQLSCFLDGSISAETLRHKYPSAWERHYGARLQLGRALQPLMLSPGSVSFTLKMMNRLPWLGRYLVAHTRDSQGSQETYLPELPLVPVTGGESQHAEGGIQNEEMRSGKDQ